MNVLVENRKKLNCVQIDMDLLSHYVKCFQFCLSVHARTRGEGEVYVTNMDLFKLVHYVPRTSIGKWAVDL